MLLSISIIAVILDQIVKLFISKKMLVGESITIINNFFNITYAKNIGAAWSILGGARLLLILISIFCLIFIYLFLIKNKKLKKLEKISYGLLIGGILGNLIDRIIYGYVIDYLDFNIFGYNYPIFNIADICIVISIIILLIITIKGDKNDNK